MSANSINDIKQDDNLQIQTEVGVNGRDFVMSCNHDVISQLMKQKLLTQIGSVAFSPSFGVDWSHYLSSDAQYQFLLSDISAAMSSVYGVSSIDLSTTEFEVEPVLELGPICFTVDCDNSTTCQEFSI